MSDEPEVKFTNLTLDDVQSLSAAYGLTLGRNGVQKPPRSLAHGAVAGGSTPDLRNLENQRNQDTHNREILTRENHNKGLLPPSGGPERVVRQLKEENYQLKKEAAVREAKLQDWFTNNTPSSFIWHLLKNFNTHMVVET